MSAQEGEPDILGSRAYITESLERGPGWQQIVFDSPFQLGEKELAGSWQAPDGPEDYYDIVLGSYPCIDGSTVAVPMAVEFARQHLGLSDEDANGLAWFNTTHNAYLELITGSGYVSGMIRSENAFLRYDETVDIIIVTAPSGNELWLAQQYGITLIQEPVCYDAFVFITHKDNPVDSLTLDQVRGIYSGEITSWRQVGGNDERIIAFQREENSGSQTGMIDLVMGDIPMLPPEKVKVAIGMGMLVDEVAEYQNNASSIGYTYRYYIDNLYKNENIKILKIDGVSAEEENLRSGAYPLTVSYYGIIRASDEQSTGGLFLDWMLSPEGQACIKQAGYIPYYE
ncbi:MAG: substrate-binding domain-containing protein [Coriobacteriia bacterium]|nr:substrate-binding domain-containing protein [Coriobacteriia bacterium]